jgi:murein DD-endopeptidase MepM/ murein hydrolase activator NlpD
MRARLTLITTIAAVLLSLVPASPVHAAAGGGTSWFSAASLGSSQVELVARFRASQRARLAAVAKVLTTPPPAPVAPPVEDPTSFVWPAHAAITSSFGRRWGRRHTGVDIDASYGSPIVAAQAGTVTLAGWKNGYGNCVIIDHGHGISTLYGHQSRLAVRTGEHVEQGQHIGDVGATGHVTAPHLHYEVLIGGVPRNPMPWLG